MTMSQLRVVVGGTGGNRAQHQAGRVNHHKPHGIEVNVFGFFREGFPAAVFVQKNLRFILGFQHQPAGFDFFAFGVQHARRGEYCEVGNVSLFVGGVGKNILGLEIEKADKQIPDERIHIPFLSRLALRDAANALLKINGRFLFRL